MELRTYIRIIKNYRNSIVIISVLVLLVYLFIISQRAKIFTATGTIVITTVKEGIISDLSFLNVQYLSLDDQLQVMDSNIIARYVSEKINRKYKIYIKPSEITASKTIVKVGTSNVIKIITKSKDKNQAMYIAREYILLGIKENQRITKEEFKKAKEFLQKQIEIYLEKIKTTEDTMKEFNDKYGVINYEEEILILKERIKKQEDQEKEIEGNIQSTQAAAAKIKNKLFITEEVKTYETFIKNPEKEDLEKETIKLQRELYRMKEHYTEDHPKIKAQKLKIKSLEEELKNIALYISEEKLSPNLMYDYLAKELMGKEIDEDAQEVKKGIALFSLGEEKGRLSELLKLRTKYMELIRSQEIAKRIYHLCYDQLENIKFQEASTTGNAKIIELPVAAKTLYPFSFYSFAFVLLISLSFSIFSVVVWEMLDDKIKTTYDVKKYLNLPIIGAVPRCRPDTNIIIDELGLKHPLSETYNKISFYLQNLCVENNTKRIIITSSKQNEGKTSILANIGISLARAGEKVLLVDMDMRKPSLHSVFNLSNFQGMSDILTGKIEDALKLSKIKEAGYPSEGWVGEISKDEIIYRCQKPTNVENLSVITSGHISHNPVEILKSKKTKEVFDLLTDKASIILFDTSPLLAVIDTSIIIPYCDAVVFVVDTLSTIRQEILEVKRIFNLTRVKILGVIINNIRFDEEHYYYYSKYHRFAIRKI